MAVAIVQLASNTGTVTTSGTPFSVVLPSVTAGSTVAFLVSRVGAGARTYAISDSASGAYTEARMLISTASANRMAGIWYRVNVGSGNLTVSITPSGGGAQLAITAIELSGVDNSDPLGQSSELDNSATLTHYAAAATGYNPIADSCSVCVFTGSAAATTLSLQSPYTSIYSNVSVEGAGFAEHGRFLPSTNQTNDRAQLNITAPANRSGPAVSAWFRPAPVGILQISNAHHLRFHGL